MAVKKEYRDLTIGEIYRGNNKVVPMLRISGMWLEELGFKSGDYVRVKCENGQIIITPNIEKAEEKAAAKTAEPAVIPGPIKVPEVSADEELVAVIAAAIAASTGRTTDDFVVRSIRRR